MAKQNSTRFPFTPKALENLKPRAERYEVGDTGEAVAVNVGASDAIRSTISDSAGLDSWQPSAMSADATRVA